MRLDVEIRRLEDLRSRLRRLATWYIDNNSEVCCLRLKRGDFDLVKDAAPAALVSASFGEHGGEYFVLEGGRRFQLVAAP